MLRYYHLHCILAVVAHETHFWQYANKLSVINYVVEGAVFEVVWIHNDRDRLGTKSLIEGVSRNKVTSWHQGVPGRTP